MNIKRLIIILTAAAALITASILLYNFVFGAARSEAEYISSASAMIFAGDNEGALKECTEGLREYPQSAELYSIKARAYQLSGDLKKAAGTLDMGYKQTKSEGLLTQRGGIVQTPADDAGFVSLTPIEDNYDVSDTSSGSSDVSSVEVERPVYSAEAPIHVNILNVTPP